jgi:tRNA (guanine37-N1)-methyltransferase
VPRLIRQALEKAGVPHPERISTGVDVIGDIAIVRLEGFGPKEKRRIGEALMAEVRNVRSVFEQQGGIEGEHRLRSVKHIAGSRKTLTIHRENGCQFKVDVARCFFSPRLSTERLRISDATARGEKVLNMFAGVGPFSIPIAKRTHATVTSCEINPYACRLHRTNNGLNGVKGLVSVRHDDALELAEKLKERYDRILMPHPSQADRFLPTALALAKRKSTIHYYRHVLGRDEEEASGNLRDELRGLVPRKAAIAIRRVREVGPRWFEMVADVRLA